MSLCGVCNKVIGNKAKLACCDCGKDFHGACLKMSRADIDCITVDGLPWRCQPCSATRRQSMRFDSATSEGNLSLEDVFKKISEVAENQKMYERNVNRSLEALSEQLKDVQAKVTRQDIRMDECLKAIENLVAENKTLHKKIDMLESRIEDMEQYSRANSVEIHGVPEEKNEDTLSVVKEVGKALDMNITDTMIDACHRLAKRPGPNNSPRGIIVKFVRRMDKEEMLKKRRVKSNFSTKHMGSSAVDQPIYVNESLSPARRRLFVAARKVKADKQYKFLWVRGGKIFLRKEESAAVHHITSQADLDKL